MHLTFACLSVAALGLVTSAAFAQTHVVRLEPQTRHQTVEGFGACLIAWVPEMRELYQTPAFQRKFIDLGMNIVRVNVWGSTLPNAVEDPADIRWEDFTFEGEAIRHKVFMDFAEDVQKLEPDFVLMGTVWSPPAWMKENGDLRDTASGAIGGDSYTRDGKTHTNRVKPEYFPHFVKWLVEIAKMHEAKGVPFDALSVGNEVMFTQTFESCLWTAKDWATVNGMLGEALEAEGLGHIRLFGPETMTGHNWHPTLANQLYIDTIKADEEAWKHFDVFATHGYTDGFTADVSQNSSAVYWDMIKGYGKPYWMTEGSTGEHAWPQPMEDSGIAAAIHNALVAGNVSAFVPWQVTESKPSHHAIMAMNEFTKKSQIARQFFNFVRPGAVRIEAAPAYGPVNASAYVHDGNKTLTVVLINSGEADRAVAVEVPATVSVSRFQTYRTSAKEDRAEVEPTAVSGGKAELTLPGRSVVTLHGETE